VRTLIEGDFFGAGGNEVFSNSTSFRLRHAWGEWDITPNTTIGVGQTYTNFQSLFASPDTVDFFGPAGLTSVRQGQVRITYRDGPWLFALGLENAETDVTSVGIDELASDPEIIDELTGIRCNESATDNICEVNDNVPDITARLQFDAPGGHRFQLSGVLRNLRSDGDLAGPRATGGTDFDFGEDGIDIKNGDSQLGWGVLGAASINLGDVATLTGTLAYGDGIGRYLSNANGSDAIFTAGLVDFGSDPDIGTIAEFDGDLDAIRSLGASASLSVPVSETLTTNVAFGYYSQNSGDIIDGMIDDLITVHTNLIWPPVSRFSMGVEGMWGDVDRKGEKSEDALRFQFGAWFFF